MARFVSKGLMTANTLRSMAKVAAHIENETTHRLTAIEFDEQEPCHFKATVVTTDCRILKLEIENYASVKIVATTVTNTEFMK